MSDPLFDAVVAYLDGEEMEQITVETALNGNARGRIAQSAAPPQAVQIETPEELARLEAELGPIDGKKKEERKGTVRANRGALMDHPPDRPAGRVPLKPLSFSPSPALLLKGSSINWKQMTAFLSLLSFGSCFALADEFLHSQYYQAWLFHNPIFILIGGLFGFLTIAGIVKSVRRTGPR